MSLLSATGLRSRIADRVLFQDVDFSLDAGQTLVVRGPSGTGKTRLLRLLAWLDQPDAGEVRLDGRTPREVGPPLWRARVAYVAQAPPVLPGCPADFAAAVGRLRCAGPVGAAREIAAELGITNVLWNRRWQELSGGERQRAHLAIAVATGPEVLLLDEPTSALDPASAARLEMVVGPFAKVWVTHDAAQASRAAGSVLDLGSAR